MASIDDRLPSTAKNINMHCGPGRLGLDRLTTRLAKELIIKMVEMEVVDGPEAANWAACVYAAVWWRKANVANDLRRIMTELNVAYTGPVYAALRILDQHREYFRQEGERNDAYVETLPFVFEMQLTEAALHDRDAGY